MHKLPLIALPLTFALGLCACAANGRNVKPVACPKPPPPPASLMQPSKAEQKVRAELFEPLPNVTRK